MRSWPNVLLGLLLAAAISITLACMVGTADLLAERARRAPSAEPGPAPKAAPAAGPRLRGRASGATMADEPSDPTPPLDPQGLTLVVRLLGLPDDVKGSVRVCLSGGFFDDPLDTATATASAPVVRFDVTRSQRRRRVRVAARHPEYVGEQATVWFPATRPATGLLEVGVRMTRAYRIEGRVVDASGRPVHGAMAALYPWEDAALASASDRPSRLEFSACERTDASGHYVLRAARPGRHLVAAGPIHDGLVWVDPKASEPELRPDGVCVRLRDAWTIKPRDLVLREASAIEGTIHIRGRPRSNLWARARFAPPPDAVYLDTGWWPWWFWTGDGVVPAGDIEPGSGRSFRIEGLAPGPHDVSFYGGYGDAADPALVDGPPVRVEAPCSNVVIEVDAVVVEVRPRDAAGPLEEAKVRIVTRSEVLHRTVNRHEKAWCLLRPGETYAVRISAAGHQDTEVVRTVPVDEDEAIWEVDVPPAEPVEVPEGGSVEVRIRMLGAPLPETGVHLVGPDGETLRLDATDEKGRARAAHVPSGWWIARAYPSCPTWLTDQRLTPYALPAEAHVLVSPGAASVVDLDLATGGLLEIAARDGRGRCVEADVRIRSASGDTLEVHCAAKLPSPSPLEDEWTECRNALLPGEPSLVDQALPPGRYEVEIQADGRPARSATATVRPGRLTRLDVDLDPTPAAVTATGGR